MLQFRADPALGVLYLVFGIREAGSPAMHRGSALDHTIGQMLDDGVALDHAAARQLATDHYDNLIQETPEEYAPDAVSREREVVGQCLDRCYPVVSEWPTAARLPASHSTQP
jgi:hypothetical protein